MPQCTPLASDAENAAGMSVDTAWKDFTTGDPSTVIAYVEAGINWHNGDAPELRNRVYLNPKELPTPSDPDGQPGLNADDFAVYNGVATPDAKDDGVVDPEDIIVRFSDGADGVRATGEADGKGYVDDISGWDFYTGCLIVGPSHSPTLHLNGDSFHSSDAQGYHAHRPVPTSTDSKSTSTGLSSGWSWRPGAEISPDTESTSPRPQAGPGSHHGRPDAASVHPCPNRLRARLRRRDAGRCRAAPLRSPRPLAHRANRTFCPHSHTIVWPNGQLAYCSVEDRPLDR